MSDIEVSVQLFDSFTDETDIASIVIDERFFANRKAEILETTGADA